MVVFCFRLKTNINCQVLENNVVLRKQLSIKKVISSGKEITLAIYMIIKRDRIRFRRCIQVALHSIQIRQSNSYILFL